LNFKSPLWHANVVQCPWCMKQSCMLKYQKLAHEIRNLFRHDMTFFRCLSKLCGILLKNFSKKFASCKLLKHWWQCPSWLSSISKKFNLKIPCRLHAPLNQMRDVVWNTQQQIQQFSSKKCGCIVRDIHNIFICHPKPWSAIFTIHLDLMVEATPFQNTFPSPSWWLRCVFGGKMFYQDKSCAQCIEVSSFWCHLLQIINCSMPNLPKVIMCTKVSKTWPLHQLSWRWTLDRNEQMFWKKGKKEHVHWILHMCL